MNHQKKIQHLCWRAGFGPDPKTLNQQRLISIEQIVAQLFEASKRSKPLDEIPPYLKREAQNMQQLSMARKMELRDLSKDYIQTLNIKWLEKMAYGKAQLRERMTLFWHDHFACKEKNALFVQQQNNTLRKYALGHFGDLLFKVAQDPAMLSFLNNKQNKKSSPNENFARELLELFTLGIGNYSERDIKEAARAFTGWKFDKDGNFKMVQRQHDDGEKVFMGQKGNWSGEDIIRIILDQTQTAEFIVSKIYRYFVNEQLDKSIVKQLARNFYQSNYDISTLMYQIFTADWFYAPENVGTKIKSPIDFLTGLMRTFKVQFTSKESPLIVQRVLGQTLFDPPNVAGWKGGRNWIDSSTMTFRMNLPTILFNNAESYIAPKSPLAMEGKRKNRFGKAKKVKARFDTNAYLQYFHPVSPQNLPLTVANYLLQIDAQQLDPQILDKYAVGNNKEAIIQNTTLALLSLPEYQLC